MPRRTKFAESARAIWYYSRGKGNRQVFPFNRFQNFFKKIPCFCVFFDGLRGRVLPCRPQSPSASAAAHLPALPQTFCRPHGLAPWGRHQEGIERYLRLTRRAVPLGEAGRVTLPRRLDVDFTLPQKWGKTALRGPALPFRNRKDRQRRYPLTVLGKRIQLRALVSTASRNMASKAS